MFLHYSCLEKQALVDGPPCQSRGSTVSSQTLFVGRGIPNSARAAVGLIIYDNGDLTQGLPRRIKLQHWLITEAQRAAVPSLVNCHTWHPWNNNKRIRLLTVEWVENKSESGVASLKQPLVLKFCELAMKQNKIITLLSMIVMKLVKSVSKQPFLQLNFS